MSTYQLYHGDCLEIMPTLEAGSVDLTVTSPPYDNLRDYGKDFYAEKFDWKAIIKELYRITKDGGVVVWVVADATINGSETGTSFKQALWAMECGFRLHDTMIYHTNKPPITANRYEPLFEYMFVFSKGKPNKANILREVAKCPGVKHSGGFRKKGDALIARTTIGRTGDDKARGNIWYLPRSSKSGDTYSSNHPATFPEQLAHDHIISWSNEGDTVFDPFSGSGTTGKMAMLAGRDFIGVELDADYHANSEKRISHAHQTAIARNAIKDGQIVYTDKEVSKQMGLFQ